MDGIHLLGEWYGCAADIPEMTRVQPLRTLCLDAAEASGMTIVGDSFYQFEPAGEGHYSFSGATSAYTR